jgi:2-polyprenyl-3-methyl-5-hydroxy-6-metoxy-1,4-benzoquinol methylase
VPVTAKTIAEGKFPEELLPILGFLEQSNAVLTDKYGARFCGYMRGYGHPVTFLLNQAESFAEAKLKDSVVLDLGCGFGIISSVFAALGAKKVVGVDLDPFMINLGMGIITETLPKHVQDRIDLQNRDILANPFEPASFDVIAAIESLSHIQSVDEAIASIRRHIKPKGRVLVSDGNNSYYVPGRIRRRAIWNNREATQYAAIREKIISENFSNLAPQEIARYVEKTQGHAAEDIVGLVRHALMTGIDPRPLKERRMMNPMTRYHEERELNPIELMHAFMRQGFYAELLRPHTNYPPEALHPKRLFKYGLRILYPLTLPVFPGFRLLMTDIRGSPNGAGSIAR